MIKLAKRKLRLKKKADAAGCKCIFYKINPRWGIKTYKSQAVCLRVVKIQKRANELGLAPKVYSGCFKATTSRGIRYCYITELAKLAKWNSIYHRTNVYLHHLPIVDELLKKIDKYWEWNDFGTDNVGFIKKKLIVIDFDHFKEKI